MYILVRQSENSFIVWCSFFFFCWLPSLLDLKSTVPQRYDDLVSPSATYRPRSWELFSFFFSLLLGISSSTCYTTTTTTSTLLLLLLLSRVLSLFPLLPQGQVMERWGEVLVGFFSLLFSSWRLFPEWWLSQTWWRNTTGTSFCICVWRVYPNENSCQFFLYLPLYPLTAIATDLESSFCANLL